MIDAGWIWIKGFSGGDWDNVQEVLEAIKLGYTNS